MNLWRKDTKARYSGHSVSISWYVDFWDRLFYHPLLPMTVDFHLDPGSGFTVSYWDDTFDCYHNRLMFITSMKLTLTKIILQCLFSEDTIHTVCFNIITKKIKETLYRSIGKENMIGLKRYVLCFALFKQRFDHTWGVDRIQHFYQFCRFCHFSQFHHFANFIKFSKNGDSSYPACL